MSTYSLQKLPSPSILGGTMIIFGTAVGAGMFPLPIVNSGVWFSGFVARCWFILGLACRFLD